MRIPYYRTIGLYSCVLCSIVSHVIELNCVLVHHGIMRGDIIHYRINSIILTMIY